MCSVVDASNEALTLAGSKSEDSGGELAVGGEVSQLGQAGELVVDLREVAVSI